MTSEIHVAPRIHLNHLNQLEFDWIHLNLLKSLENETLDKKIALESENLDKKIALENETLEKKIVFENKTLDKKIDPWEREFGLENCPW